MNPQIGTDSTSRDSLLPSRDVTEVPERDVQIRPELKPDPREAGIAFCKANRLGLGR